MPRRADREDQELVEIAIVGDLTEQEAEITERLLEVPPGGECVLYFDSPGGSTYAGMALLALMRLRGTRATGIVTGECSSAALWPFAACTRRVVTPYSVFLFHPMRWESAEHVGLAEAAEWARHFGQLESDMDRVLSELLKTPPELLASWTRPGRYVSGTELARHGLAELVELAPLPTLARGPRSRKRPRDPG